MNKEDKIYELLEKIYVELQETKKDLNDFREETNNRFDSLENKIDDLDAHNANRHVAMVSDIDKLSANLLKLEIVTADNWSDIARIKARKRMIR